MKRSVVLLAALSLLLLGATSAGASPPDTHPGGGVSANHAKVVDYWTADRVANAVPREITLDKLPAGVNPMKGKPPGTGGGGGGNSGSPWTGGGAVVDTTGKVLFTMGGVDYVCSGSTVDDSSNSTSMILTAGHCLYDDAANAFATNWLFVPNYEASETFDCDAAIYGCWTADALVTTTAWAGSDFNHDYAFAIVGPGGHSGEALQLDAVVGTQSIAFNQSHPATVHSFGYPHASPYDGQDLIYCDGLDVVDGWGGSTDFGLKCDMTGGSSGGPWFLDFNEGSGTGTLTSVNSFKYTAGKYKSYMFGPYLGSYAESTYNAALSANGNTLVSP